MAVALSNLFCFRDISDGRFFLLFFCLALYTVEVNLQTVVIIKAKLLNYVSQLPMHETFYSRHCFLFVCFLLFFFFFFFFFLLN